MYSSTYARQSTSYLPSPVTTTRHSRSGDRALSWVEIVFGLIFLLVPLIILVGGVGVLVDVIVKNWEWQAICQTIVSLWQGFWQGLAAVAVAVFRGLCFLFTLVVLGMIIAKGASALGCTCSCCRCIDC